MIVRRFFDPKLAQTSYLLGCGRKGVAVVIDPNRDVEQYIRAAELDGLAITHVTETHIHADFVSGSRALAKRTGAQLHLSDEGGPDWSYAFAKQDGASLVRDGDRITVGNIILQVVHTPGHTPEHISFLVTDSAAADEPIAMATGDFVFVGDVGRPDLLEKAAGGKGTMEPAARTLSQSLDRFRTLPDWLQIWPGHGAGSACGKGLSSVPHSTVGYERRFNWALSVTDEAEFVRMVLAGQPEPPRYFAEMKRINREGPPLTLAPPPRHLEAKELAGLLQRGEIVIDTRPAAVFATRHVPGTLNIPLNKSFSTWVGSLVPYDRDLHLIVDETAGASAASASLDLAMIGLDRVAGWFGVDALAVASESAGQSTIPQMACSALVGSLGRREVTLLDVRGAAEWEAGHIEGSMNIALGDLPRRIAEVPRDRPLIVQCQSGGRSSIAASVLRQLGIEDVTNLVGGIVAWHEEKREVIVQAGQESAAWGS